MNIKQLTKSARSLCLCLGMCVALLFTVTPTVLSQDKDHYHEPESRSSLYLRLKDPKIQGTILALSEQAHEHEIEDTKAYSETENKQSTKKETVKTENKSESKPQTKPDKPTQSTNTNSNTKPDTDKNTSNRKEMTVTATAYCGCYSCNGQWTGYPAADGSPMKALHTIAAAESIPFGTKVYIPYFDSYSNGGMFEVEDRGSAITEGRIDIYFDSHEEALKFGMKELKIYIVE